MLDERIQQFVWAEGWEDLRDAQELAIPPIINCDLGMVTSPQLPKSAFWKYEKECY